MFEKTLYNSSSHNTDILKQELTIKRNCLINNPFDLTVWQLKKWLKTQLEKNFIELRILYMVPTRRHE